ncbi:ankyrin repeat-containing domain protein [Mycena capillaripes]|nr:ankyrin repeat-containing domain protein [Mycena capillaripes]
MLPTYRNLVDILEILLTEISRTYIVLDALDECKDSVLLIRLISRLRGWTTNRLHVLFTSQPREIFTIPFEGVPQVALEFNTTHSDIRLFVYKELQTNPDLEHLAQRVVEVAAKVVEKSKGMFRLAACLLDELSRQKLGPDLHTILANLPGDLFGIYSRFLRPIHPRDFIHVARFLRWLLYAWRPMTLPELEDALAFDFSDPEQFLFDPTKRGKLAGRICKMLQGVVTVSQQRNTSVVTLAHSSVADYMVSTEFRDKHNQDLGHAPSQSFLAQTCIGYQLFFVQTWIRSQIPFNDFPMSSYVMEGWMHHFRHCTDYAVLVNSTMRVLRAEKGRTQYSPDYWVRRLIFFVRRGFTEAVQFLLENVADARRADGFQIILTAVSKAGYTDIVRHVLKNSSATSYGCALLEAYLGGHRDIVGLLLENGADPISVDNGYGGRVWRDGIKYRSMLHAASAKGDIDTARLLLRYGAEVNAADGFHGSALRAAYEGGHLNVVRLLLQNGAACSSTTLSGKAL